jgi:hypothetical protein
MITLRPAPARGHDDQFGEPPSADGDEAAARSYELAEDVHAHQTHPVATASSAPF